jgi:hypothetical protein
MLTSSIIDYRSQSIIDRHQFPWITIDHNRLLPRTIHYSRTEPTLLDIYICGEYKIF